MKAKVLSTENVDSSYLSIGEIVEVSPYKDARKIGTNEYTITKYVITEGNAVGFIIESDSLELIHKQPTETVDKVSYTIQIDTEITSCSMCFAVSKSLAYNSFRCNLLYEPLIHSVHKGRHKNCPLIPNFTKELK